MYGNGTVIAYGNLNSSDQNCAPARKLNEQSLSTVFGDRDAAAAEDPSCAAAAREISRELWTCTDRGIPRREL